MPKLSKTRENYFYYCLLLVVRLLDSTQTNSNSIPMEKERKTFYSLHLFLCVPLPVTGNASENKKIAKNLIRLLLELMTIHEQSSNSFALDIVLIRQKQTIATKQMFSWNLDFQNLNRVFEHFELTKRFKARHKPDLIITLNLKPKCPKKLSPNF